MVDKSIAIIPARGGSKRIPRKNLIEFFGKPLIAWTIDAALNSNCFDEVLVSTDDEEIAAVSREFGASVPFLRKDHADDYSSVSQATISSLNQAEFYWGIGFSTVVQLMPNCPLRVSEDITEALQSFNHKNVNFQVSCFKFGWMNPWWSAKLDSNGRPEWLFPEALSARSQDLDKLYSPTGAIWVAQSGALKKAGTFYGPGCVFQPISWISAIDIDDMEDYAMAKAAWLLRKKNFIEDA